MFKLFKKKNKIEELQTKYERLMSQWHELSSINRTESDKKYAEAEAVLQEIEILHKA